MRYKLGDHFGPIKSLVDVKHVHSFDRIGVLAVNDTLETQTAMKLIGPTSILNSPDLAASSIVDVTHTSSRSVARDMIDTTFFGMQKPISFLKCCNFVGQSFNCSICVYHSVIILPRYTALIKMTQRRMCG